MVCLLTVRQQLRLSYTRYCTFPDIRFTEACNNAVFGLLPHRAPRRGPTVNQSINQSIQVKIKAP